MNDIAPRRGVTTFLQTLDGDYATFFDLVPDLLVCTDQRGGIVRVNRSFERSLGYTRSEMYGKGLANIVLSEDFPAFFEAFQKKSQNSFRLLHKNRGVATCRLICWNIRHGRSFIVLRPVHE